MLIVSPTASVAAVQEGFIVGIDNTTMAFYPGGMHPGFAMFLGVNTFVPNTALNHIDIKQVSENIYHLRNNLWKNFFWKIDVSSAKIYRVRNGVFGVQGGTETPLDSIIVNVGPASANNKFGPPSWVRLDLKNALLELNPFINESRFSVEGDDILVENEWEIQRVGSKTYHFRFKRFSDIFFKIDANSMKSFWITSGHFGTDSGKENPIPWKVQSVKTIVPAPSKPAIMEDIEMAQFANDQPVSAWFENEKALYRNVLKHESYDVLIVPFQVQEYAIDRIGRSLMTRNLAHRIETTASQKIPSPTLVAKALGELQRTFSDKDVYQLANDLNVKTIIKGYVGHNRDEKLKLIITVQTRDDHGRLSSSTPLQTLEWNDIPFSDEHLPSEVFYNMLDEIMSKLPFKQTAKIEPKILKKEKKLAIPRSLAEMVEKSSSSPVLNVYYLQLLGSLYPEPTQARDYLFERSLIALTDVSPKSPDYALLKARAYHYLHRRPAAVELLKSSSSSEEKALAAFINGNLHELEKHVNNIEDPLPKLLAQIELNDLKRTYDDKFIDQGDYKLITRSIPIWKDIVQRRLDNDMWTEHSNFVIKSMLDDLLPIENFTAKDIAISQIALGDINMEHDDIELSVYVHYRKLLENQSEKFADNESRHLVKRDILDLMAAIGESNLFQKLRCTASSCLERTLTRLERYGTIYKGHPFFTSLQCNVLGIQSGEKQGSAHDNLFNQAKAMGRNACYWLQGQFDSYEATYSCIFDKFFDGDYPRRWYWNDVSNSTPGDRSNAYGYFQNRMYTSLSEPLINKLKNLDVALRYSISNFKSLETYHRELAEHKLLKEAESLAEANKNRFVGHPSHWIYFAGYKEKAGDTAGAQKLYTEAIAAMPKEWKLYEQLGKLFIKQGKPKKAANLFRRYPGFNIKTDDKTFESLDSIAPSNQALHAAQTLFACGDFEDSKFFYKLGSDYVHTPVGMGISGIMLSIMSNDYYTAAHGLRELAKTNKFPPSYSRYAAILHAMGFHGEAWALFNNNNLISYLYFNETADALITGLHTESKNEDEENQWWLHQDLTKVRLNDVQNAFLLSKLTDRFVDERLPATMTNLDNKIIAAGRNNESTFMPSQSMSPIKMRSWAAWFADAYGNLQRHNYAIAYKIFLGTAQPFETDNCNNFRCFNRSFALPYTAWSFIKNNKTLDNYLKIYKGKMGETFDYHLALAFLNGGRKNHKEALANLKAAQFNMPEDKMRPLPAWYQLIETYEWLYEDSGNAEYREQIIKLAKICQVIHPFQGWPYAFEAKYTNSEADRIRALALTLYLDKRSEHISSFSDHDKQKALEWLKSNNPFLKENETEGGKSEARKNLQI